MQSNLLQQIHLGLGPDGFKPVAQHKGDASTYVREHEEFQRALLRVCPAKVWPKSCNVSACPRPVLMGEHHQQQLSEVHEALTVAVTDIVQRWWSDAGARFPERMPLEAQEEDLLQWIETQVLSGRPPEYSKCRGSWRPDFLVEEHRDSEGKKIGENFRITEINARFAFNGYMVEAHGQQTLDDMGILARHGLKSAASAEKYIDGLLGLFRPDLPLHLLKGEEHGMDIHMFIHMVEQRLGVTPRLITPQDLRLLPDENGKGGYKLCCVVDDGNKGASAAQNPTFSTSNRELVQEIHQVGLKLHQHEFRALDAEILRQISLRCFNDMRTILLVHDKRMLGIVKQESALLIKRRILTTEQALIIDKGIADTVLPSSPDLHRLFNKSKCSIELKNKYFLKPAAEARGRESSLARISAQRSGSMHWMECEARE
ncbi:hypothetical protein EsDP_00006302 [Epichloe bromicola]|uniref:Uncharacterized protein n=1 Tax=Epichloe bromicola TaxID=79588 RepID=A0ABQ0CXA1_9HYPO